MASMITTWVLMSMCRNRTDSKQFCGGISVMSGAMATITNCKITGNKADKSDNSGAGEESFKYIQ